MIIELPNYIDLKTVNDIKQTIKPYINYNKHNTYNRDGHTVTISTIPELTSLDSTLHTIFTDIQQNIIEDRYKPRRSSADTGYEYHLYKPGDVCHYHADGEISESFLRYASVVLHLNTVKDGGELVFPSQNKSIKTEAGKVVIFPPYGMYGHYTTPSSEDREIIVSWFIYDKVVISERQ